MSTKAQSEGPISLPKGGGALHGIGEKFSPDLHTGTGNFTVPIALPPGRNGFQPQLMLVYSTGNGNGRFGLGWNLSIPGVSRKTSHGIPRYDDSKDVFILSGAEDLVPVTAEAEGSTRYRPRTEGLFARIEHHRDAKNNFWEVRSKDGLVSYYGSNPDSNGYPILQPPQNGDGDTATLSKPNDSSRIFSWKLTLTKDPFGNRIEYLYDTDEGEDGFHRWRQPLLHQIRYADYTDQQGQNDFLITVTFDYEDRPDPFSEYRPGFEIRTTKRCRRIQIRTHAGADILVRSYDLVYLDQRRDLQNLGTLLPLNGVSLLSQIKVIGHDGTLTEELPPLEFAYTRFEPERRDLFPLEGRDLPAQSLASRDLELVDLFGNGLPDILEMNGTVRYWRNLGGFFDLPREMKNAPAGVVLADKGVQLIDANGDGRTDLLVSTETISGYYPLRFGGLWDRRSFQRYRTAPSFDLEDPEVRLVDLDGDGVTDAVRSGSRLECFFNDPKEGWNNTCRVERMALDQFSNINFSDPRVKWADMTGDGLQDIILVSDGNVEYWPHLGCGNWAKRIHMRNSPRLPYGYDTKRILVGDVDGDGLADIVYVDDTKLTLWINQSGNSWSEPVVIKGTPPVSDMDAVRLADMLGSGISGVLWSANAGGLSRESMFFHDFSGATKPYLLSEMDNHMGAVTKVHYAPSTPFYLEDQKKPATRWKAPLPFPVQVVVRVEVIDAISGGKLTTEYRYHHGYWDGAEREFRGFGMVEQLDAETFEDYEKAGLHGRDFPFASVDRRHFSPPTLAKTWFHQGPVGEEFGEWQELGWSDEYWTGDPQLLNHTEAINRFLRGIQDRRAKRDALRTLRGSILRTELYALDGSDRKSRPYTVVEYAYGLREELPPDSREEERSHIFFPHTLTQRTTQWERGDDPMTQFAFTDDYDEFGQPRQQTAVALPRRAARRRPAGAGDETRVLATHTRTTHASPDPGFYLRDRVAHVRAFEIRNPSGVAEADSGNLTQVLVEQANTARAIHQQFRAVLDSWAPGQPLPRELRLISHTIDHYDGGPGQAFIGRPSGEVGPYGALTRSESLAFTDVELDAAYGAQRPAYLGGAGPLPVGASADFGNNLGYRREQNTANGYHDGYYFDTQRQKFDFHETASPQRRGLVIGAEDAFGHESTIRPDDYWLLPVEVTDPAGLTTTAVYDYRVWQPVEFTDPNWNRTSFTFTPLGLLASTAVRGKSGNKEGDHVRPSVQTSYDFLAFENSPPAARKPIYVRTLRHVHHDTETGIPLAERDETIETVEYSDGFGRLLQTRTQAEDVLFDSRENPIFGDAGLPSDPSARPGNAVGTLRSAHDPPNVVVNGWQTYDNKGRVVEKYEPFFAQGWQYTPPQEAQLGQRATVFYDPRGHTIRTVDPDGSQQRIVYGVPLDLDDPEVFSPTPWETFTYDANDNAGRTHPGVSGTFRHHWNTAASARVDALGRTLETVQRNRAPSPRGQPQRAIELHRSRTAFDIQGNVSSVVDPLGRTTFRYHYDLNKRALRTASIDAGDRRTVLDALNLPIQQWDSKGAVLLRAYDLLSRPTRVWASDGPEQPLTLRQHFEYGDAGDPAQPAANRTANRDANTLGKPVRQYDEAGFVSFDRFDFKGNLLDKSRWVIRDDALLAVFGGPADPVSPFRIDWAPPAGTTPAQHAAGLLDGTSFQFSSTYDALNRLKTLRYPEAVDGLRSELRPRYNRAGALDQLALNGNTYVEHIAYNATRQRLLVAYGNGVMTRHAYDSQTFRLVRMRTELYTRPDGVTFHPEGGLLQDFAYTYDLAGNILSIRDQVHGSGFINNPEGGVDALLRQFEYDALNRLSRATGREANNIPNPRPWLDNQRSGYDSGNHGTADQDSAPNLTQGYSERYTYDPAGNLISLQHGSNGQPSWTRHFGMGGLTPAQWQHEWASHWNPAKEWLNPPGNRLTHVGGATQTHRFDENGNLVQEHTERHFAWDHSDRLKTFRIQPENGPTSVYAHYLYDAGGQRVKKLVRTGANRYDVTVYIDGVFEYHRQVRPRADLSNNSLHVMDNQTRFAVRRVGAAFPGDGAPQASIKYYLGDHLGSSHLVIGGDAADANDFVNREEYFPYGETSFGSFARKRYRYSGKERDEESGLSYHGARYYAPWCARWMTCDPIVSENLYVAYANNPTNRIDPLGTSERPPNVDTPEAIIRQLQEKSIIADTWRISGISDKEEAQRKQLDNVLVIGRHGTMSQAAHRQKEENYRNSALLSGGRDLILGAMLFDIARSKTDDPSVWMAADVLGNAFMRVAGGLAPAPGSASAGMGVSLSRPLPGHISRHISISRPSTAGSKSGENSIHPLVLKDMQALGARLKTSLSGPSEGHKTLAIGLVSEKSNPQEYRYVYTANGNWTNAGLERTAQELGLTRWTATPSAKGRGDVGAPGDAEQLLMEAAVTNRFSVWAIVPSRTACADCQCAMRHEGVTYGTLK